MFCLSSTFLLLVNLALMRASNHREKRLVLHSDTDMVEEPLILKANVSYLVSENSKQNDKIHNLETALASATSNKYGSVYVRWGRNTCAGSGTQLIYKGYMAGSDYTQTGNGPNSLCLPDNPTWAKYDDRNQGSDRAYIYGSEFDEHGDIFDKHIDQQDVPCAVCKSPGVSLMIPARTNCYPGWHLEYTGYLMSMYHGHSSPTDYMCVDKDPEFIPGGGTNTNGHVLSMVESICGTLLCPPYVNYRELACSVCSMY